MLPAASARPTGHVPTLHTDSSNVLSALFLSHAFYFSRSFILSALLRLVFRNFDNRFIILVIYQAKCQFSGCSYSNVRISCLSLCSPCEKTLRKRHLGVIWHFTDQMIHHLIQDKTIISRLIKNLIDCSCSPTFIYYMVICFPFIEELARQKVRQEGGCIWTFWFIL